MRAKLKELRAVVEKAAAKKRIDEALRSEVIRVLGSAVVIDDDNQRLAENVNDRLDVLERTGRAKNLQFKASVLSHYINDSSSEMRRFVARVLPENYVMRMCNDVDPFVMHTVARRSPVRVVKEMYRLHSNDDELAVILEEKKQKEDDDEGYTLNRRRMGDLARPENSQEDELSDVWYAEKAHKLIQDYGGNIEGQWEEIAVRRYCSSLRTTSGIEVDGKKLLKHVRDLETAHDDRTLKRYELKEVARQLREGVEFDVPSECIIDDVSRNLMSSLTSCERNPSQFIKDVNQIFNVRESVVPAGLRKYCVSEGVSLDTMIPCSAIMPNAGSYDDERVLDSYVKYWNRLQESRGEPIRIAWVHNPTLQGKVTFTVELK